MFTPQEIRRIRLQRGLTLLEFANLLGVTESTVCKWEASRAHPRYGVMVKLNELAQAEAPPPPPKQSSRRGPKLASA